MDISKRDLEILRGLYSDLLQHRLPLPSHASTESRYQRLLALGSIAAIRPSVWLGLPMWHGEGDKNSASYRRLEIHGYVIRHSFARGNTTTHLQITAKGEQLVKSQLSPQQCRRLKAKRLTNEFFTTNTRPQY